jgi:hypothetical protein
MQNDRTNGNGAGAVDLTLPNELLDAIEGSHGDQRRILAELDLANRIMNANMAQQNAVAIQQAMYQLNMAAVAKCVDLIAAIDPMAPNAVDQLREYRELVDTFMEQFQRVAAMVRIPTESDGGQLT